MTQAELDSLVAQIGEEILARAAKLEGAKGSLQAIPGKKGEGLNLPDQVCPGCVQRCAQTCARNTKEIIAAGADRVSASDNLTKIDPAIAALIDHTILKPDATRTDVVKVCREARQYSFASVCVNPYWVPLVRAELAGSPVKVCTVVGFPLGATSTEAKVAETQTAVRAGAQEIDMVINVGALRSGDRDAVRADIEKVARASHEAGAIVKVILETALLDDTQKTVAVHVGKDAGADFVKTSTGFSTSGATAHDIALMRAAVGPDGSQGIGRHSHAARCAGHDRGRRDADRRQRQREDRRGHRCLASSSPGRRRPPRTPRERRRSASASDRNCWISCWKFRRPRRKRWTWTSFRPTWRRSCRTYCPTICLRILLYNEKRGDLRIRYAVGHREDVVRNLSVALGEGVTGAAAAQREPVLVGDVRNDPRYLNTVDAVRTELAVPMTARGKLVGVIDLQSTRVNAYTEYDRALMRLIAARVASRSIMRGSTGAWSGRTARSRRWPTSRASSPRFSI